MNWLVRKPLTPLPKSAAAAARAVGDGSRPGVAGIICRYHAIPAPNWLGSGTRISMLTGLVTGTALALAYLFVAWEGIAGTIDPGGVVLVIGAFTSVSGTLGNISSTFVAVDQHPRGFQSQCLDRAGHGEHSRPVDVDAVDLLDRSNADAVGRAL